MGRATELTQLQGAFASARDEGFRCVPVSAEAGVGKTRLSGELLTLHADDAVVLQSRARPMGSGVAFGAWVEALDPLVQSMGDDEVAEACGGFLDDLAGLFHRVAALRGVVDRCRRARTHLHVKHRWSSSGAGLLPTPSEAKGLGHD